MKRIVLGACVLTGLAACDHPTRPLEPAITAPAAGVTALQQEFTFRDLRTLGGTRSDAPSMSSVRSSARLTSL